jgi:hypothetical protein
MTSGSVLKHRLQAAGACGLGVLGVAAVFSPIELWSNLFHDPFLPNVRAHGWTVLRFNFYGALFIGAMGGLGYWAVLVALRLQTAAPTRRRLLFAALCGAALFLLLHHSRHILLYWSPGGGW